MADPTQHLPSRLPAREADLDEWSVYADHLLTIGDRRGDLVSHELTLPASLLHDQVAAFHALANPLCHRSTATPATWCLGQIRTLDIANRGASKSFRSGPPEGALARAHSLLRSPLGARLESLACFYEPAHPKAWRRLLQAIPPSCRTVTIGALDGTTVTSIAEWIGWLPSHVRELEVLWTFVYPAAEAVLEVALRAGRFDSVTIRTNDVRRLDAIAQRTAGLSIEIRLRCTGAMPLPPFVIGARDDAAVVHLAAKTLTLLERPSWLELQDRYGVMPVRTQIARSLPESYLKSSSFQWMGGECATLVRRGDTWSFRREERHRLDDSPSPPPLHDGDIFDGTNQLIASDVDARCRALLA